MSAAEEAPLLTVDGLGVSFADGRRRLRAVHDLHLRIGVGERLALLGESGSGKTVTAMAVAGLLPEEARIEGRIGWPAFAKAPVLGRDIGVVLQDPMSSLDPVLTIGEQIGEVLVTHEGIGWGVARERATALLRRVGIEEPERRVDTFPHRLSGGQRQRAAIAMAIAAGPRLLVADEPTTALDTVVQARIMALLDELARAQGMALLLVTHDLALASGIADRAAVLYAGRLVEVGPIDRMVKEPRHPYTRGLLASSLDFDRPAPGRLEEIAGTLPDPSEPIPGCPFAARCPEVRSVCHERFPAWSGTDADGVACVLHPPSAAGQ